MFNKLFKSEGGFTLVELLITIAILGVLFGITTLTLSGVGTDAADASNAAEFAVVQSAIDVYMAQYNDDTITALSPEECLVGSQVIDGSVTTSDYLRGDSNCEYGWTTAGVVTVDTCDCSP